MLLRTLFIFALLFFTTSFLHAADECTDNEGSATLNSSSDSYTYSGDVNGRGDDDTFYVNVTEPGAILIQVSGNRIRFSYDETGCPDKGDTPDTTSQSYFFLAPTDFNIRVYRKNGNARKDYDLSITFVPFKPLVDYRMDECQWNGTTDEVIDSSTNILHATAKSGAITLDDAQICRGGDFDSHYLEVTDPPQLASKWSLTSWVKFPLGSATYKTIASVDGTGDLAYFITDTIWGIFTITKWGVYDNNGDISDDSISMPSDGWHHVAIINNGSSTSLYFDATHISTLNKHTDGNLRYIATSSDDLTGQTMGTVMDEFKIFNDLVLTQEAIDAIYNREQNSKNFDNTDRECNICLLAEYHFDECYWDGRTGEVQDHILGDNNGTITGAVRTTDEERKVCYSGAFSGGAIDIDNLDVNTSDGAKTSVAFWMYWDGTNSVMPFGWNMHDLWFYEGNFGFNSANGDIFGISSSGLENGWHHVAAVFTNGDIPSNKLYIDGTDQALSQLRNSPNNSRSVVQSSARIGGWKYNDGYRFSGYLDELYISNGEIDSDTVTQIMNATHSCKCIAPKGSWNLDECFWNETADEVEDSSHNNYHGNSKLGATTQKSSEAGGGLCNVGIFSDNYVELPNFPHLNDSRSITAWFKTTDRSERGQRIFADDENNNDGSYALSVGDPGAGKVRFYIRGLSAVSLDSDAVVQNNVWYFAAAIFDASSMEKRLLIYDESGNILSDVHASVSGTIGTQTGTPSIGGETTEGETANRFSGNIDEVKVFNGALTLDQVELMMNQTHPCGCAEAVAGYYFDKCLWDGTSEEVADEILGDNNGTRTGVNVNTTDTEAKVCKSALFNGDAIDINNLDVNTSNEAKTSVAFWMYWDGTNSVMPFGWHSHDLWFYDGNFGFNSANGDIFGISSSGLENSWHHITAVFTNGNIHSDELYVDGVKQSLTQKRNSPKNSRAVVQNSARIGGWLRSDGYRFKGYLDEFYIYKGPLKLNQIQILMNETHPCQCIIVDTPRFHFDAWDVFRDINDRNVSTKIANDTFELTVASLNDTDDDYEEFNGTVCSQIIDVQHSNSAKSSWVKTLFNDTNTSIVGYHVISAVKEAKVGIKWQRNADVDCTAMVEDNSTISSDAFAIRPQTFTCNFNGVSSPLIAEHEYNLSITAQDALNGATDDYNTSSVTITANKYMNNGEKNDTLHGDLTLNSINTFSNGVSNGTISFNDVGIIGVDINDSNWADVDADDTPEYNRTIHSECNVTFGADHFELNFPISPLMENNNSNFTYLSNDLNMSAWLKNLSLTVTAKGENNSTLQNYQEPQSSFFAKNVDVTPTLLVPDTPYGDSVVVYNAPTSKIDETLNFQSGKADINYSDVKFNYPRIYHDPKNPFTILGSDSNISVTVIEHDNSAVSGSITSDFNDDSTFYFARLRPNDIKTSQDNSNSAIEIEVYDSTDSHFINGFKRNSLNWYRHKNHTSDTFGDASYIDATTTTTYTNPVDFSIPDANIANPNSGVIDVTLPQHDGRYILHVKTQPWLWYIPKEFGSEYSDAINSKCTEHPCFIYVFEDNSGAENVSTGEFKGGTSKVYDKGSYSKTGVKVFR